MVGQGVAVPLRNYLPGLLVVLALLAPAIGRSQTAALKFEKKIGVPWRQGAFGWMSFVAFSSDGTMVASDGPASPNDLSGTLKLWSFPEGKLIKRLPEHPFAISPDWKYYATDHGVVNMERRRPVPSLSGGVHEFTFSPDSRYVVDGNRGIHVFELPSGKLVSSFGKLASGGVAISPDSITLAAGHWDIVVLWNMLTGERLATLRGFGRYASPFFSSDGRLLAVGTDTGGLQIWDVKSLAKLASLDLRGPVSDVQFSPDGRLVAVGVYGLGTAFLIDVASGKIADRHRVSDMGCGSVAFSPDGRYLITPSTGGLVTWPYDRGGTIRVFRVEQKEKGSK